MPKSFKADPKRLDKQIPDELKYEYMIHIICKTYGVSKKTGGQHTETDYWELAAFENNDNSI